MSQIISKTTFKSSCSSSFVEHTALQWFVLQAEKLVSGKGNVSLNFDGLEILEVPLIIHNGVFEIL